MNNGLTRLALTAQVRFLVSERGQDLIEYTLLVGLLAVTVAATFPATLMPNVSTIFSKVGSSMSASGS